MKAGMVSSEIAIYTVSGIQGYEAAIELYPNPTTDKCVVRCADRVLNVSVYNVFGQLLETVPADGNSVEVSLGQFATGTYFLRVATENGIATRKVVRK
ncbi:MAG: T9SS type A sorting domain-containing protein [Bacteroidales bacterium]|nr:T9SS type A sorting domain-containing protein [Bacteroidales bacterium]